MVGTGYEPTVLLDSSAPVDQITRDRSSPDCSITWPRRRAPRRWTRWASPRTRSPAEDRHHAVGDVARQVGELVLASSPLAEERARELFPTSSRAAAPIVDPDLRQVQSLTGRRPQQNDSPVAQPRLAGGGRPGSPRRRSPAG